MKNPLDNSHLLEVLLPTMLADLMDSKFHYGKFDDKCKSLVLQGADSLTSCSWKIWSPRLFTIS